MTQQYVLISLASIIVLGITAQWLAWRLRVPSLLLLLAFGILAGPASRYLGSGLFPFLDTDRLLGDLRLPLISLSVALILFEGGLRLRIRELHEVGRELFALVTVGMFVTWTVSTLAAHSLLGFNWPLASLQGAILVVTGPTVIGPLLRFVRLRGRLGALLRWEGIVIDPVGAMLAVLVFQGVLIGEFHRATTTAGVVFIKTILIGSGLGLLGAGFLVLVLRRYWIPDTLHHAASFMAVVSVFSGCNWLQPDSGWLAVTLMGITLANQRIVTVKHIMEFKENLSILLISSLFIVLAARLRPTDLAALDLKSILFFAILVFVTRPAAVLLSTLGSRLTWQEKLFLCWMAPRGIVAASVASVFALVMGPLDSQAERLVPVTFLVIIGTVAIYGLSAPFLVRHLHLAQPNPKGVLFIGAHSWTRAVASALQAQGCPVMVADSNWSNISAARLAGLPTWYGSVLSDHAQEELGLGEMGHLLALTSNDEVNSLACMRFIEFFGRRKVYQLPFKTGTGRLQAVSPEHRGRFLFGPGMTSLALDERFQDKPIVMTTNLTKEFDFEAFLALNGNAVLPVCLVKENGQVAIFTAEDPPAIKPGQVLISLASPTNEKMSKFPSEPGQISDKARI